MLTLYYSPGACSLATHIALCENKLQYQLQKVDLATKKVADGADFYKINPKGYVPTLQLGDGTVLTEGVAILLYITEAALGEPYTTPGNFDRYRLVEALTFVSTEFHKGLGAFFNPKIAGEYKDSVVKKIMTRFDALQNILTEHQYLAGDQFTVADAYLYAILRWMPALKTGLDLNDWPIIQAYYNKIEIRPLVQKALKEEGLLKE